MSDDRTWGTEFCKAVAAFQAECPVVQKTSTGQIGSQRYKYAPLDQVVETVGPLMSKHGLGRLHEMTDVDRSGPGIWVTVTTTVFHVQTGQYKEAAVKLQSDGGDPKRMGSAFTYGVRYGLCHLLGIVSDEDDDGDAANRKPQSAPQIDHQYVNTFSQDVANAKTLEDLHKIRPSADANNVTIQACRKVWKEREDQLAKSTPKPY